MTVSAQEALVEHYVGDGEQNLWPVPFPFLTEDDICAVITAPDATQQFLRKDRDYTIVRWSDKVGGVLQTEVPAGFRLTIYLEQPFTQEMDLRNNGILDAEMLEFSLDKLTLMLGQLRDRLVNCVQVGMTENKSADELLVEFRQGVIDAVRAAAQAQQDSKSAALDAEKATRAIEHLVNTEEIGAAMLLAINAAFAGGLEVLDGKTDALITRLQQEFATLSPGGKNGATLSELRVEGNTQVARIETVSSQAINNIRIEVQGAVRATNTACECAEKAFGIIEDVVTEQIKFRDTLAAALTSITSEGKKQIDTIAGYLTSSEGSLLPRGMIVLWSGTLESIPKGWALCDGTNGTPNLRSRFVIGAGGDYNPHERAGSTKHGHPTTVWQTTLALSQIPSHNHTNTLLYMRDTGSNSPGLPDKSYPFFKASSKSDHMFSGPVTSAGGGGSHGHGASTYESVHMPPYYALAYIMKI